VRIPRTTLAAVALLSLVPAAASPCSAASITYDINQTIGAGGVTGDIITDGKIGILEQADIVDWNLLLNDGTNTKDLLGPLSGSNSVVFVVLPSSLSATATQLLFDFGATDIGTRGNGFIFESAAGSDHGYLCFNSESCVSDIPSPPPGTGVEQLISNTAGNIQSTDVTGMQVIGTAAIPSSAPEPSTLALLSAGIAILGFRRLRQAATKSLIVVHPRLPERRFVGHVPSIVALRWRVIGRSVRPTWLR
jgi:hypothetical protein